MSRRSETYRYFCLFLRVDGIGLFGFGIYQYSYILMQPPTAQGYSDFFAYIFLCYRPRLVQNEDVLDLDTSFERLDVHVIRDCIIQSGL